jgi:hypothetical protein
MSTNITFTVHGDGKSDEVTFDELREFAEAYGLERAAPGRYSHLFTLNLMLLQKNNGINPFAIVTEIKALEGTTPPLQTKPASQFSGDLLKGLWHKHFFAGNLSLIAHNIANQLPRAKLTKLVNAVMHPSKGPVVTAEMIRELSNRVVYESLETRGAEGKLTGEWIVFAKRGEKNYYLCIATHETGDQVIRDQIKAVCVPQFSFLSSVMA